MKFAFAIATLAASSSAHLLHFGGANGLWRESSFIQTQDPLEPTPAISPVNYDDWVYEFSRENMNPIARVHAQKNKSVKSNNFDNEVR